jgi:hypothetical protein
MRSNTPTPVLYRNPFFHWVLLMVTCGLYVPVWAFRMAREIDQLGGPERIRVQLHERVFRIGYAVYLLWFFLGFLVPDVGGFISDNAYLSNALLVLALALTLHLIWILLSLGKQLRALSSTSTPSAKAIVGLYLFLCLALPFLQSRLNRIVLQHTR